MLTLMRMLLGANATDNLEETLSSISALTLSHFVVQKLDMGCGNSKLIDQLRGFYCSSTLGVLKYK